MAFSGVLPKVVADTGPGGQIFTNYNAVTQANLANQEQAIKNQYLPATSLADAASKMAYANLMGPQFLSKLFGNQNILANVPEEQKGQILGGLLRAGGGQGTGNALLNFSSLPTASTSGGLFGLLMNKLIGSNGANSSSAPSSNTLSNVPSYLQNQPNVSQRDVNSINNLGPGQSYVVQGNNAQPPPSFAQNAASYAGTVKQGEKTGEIRAQDINDLGDAYQGSQNKLATIDQINGIIRSPTFEQIRQLPAAGQHELAFYQRYGTPEQQNMVGQLVTLSGNVIRDAAQDFKGAFRKGEQGLLQNMKINPGDTVDAARGKMEQLTYLTQLLGQRSKLAADYMTSTNANKADAIEYANKNINADQIKQQVHDTLNPTITIRNKKTGETQTVPIAQARKLGVPNV